MSSKPGQSTEIFQRKLHLGSSWCCPSNHNFSSPNILFSQHAGTVNVFNRRFNKPKMYTPTAKENKVYRSLSERKERHLVVLYVPVCVHDAGRRIQQVCPVPTITALAIVDRAFRLSHSTSPLEVPYLGSKSTYWFCSPFRHGTEVCVCKSCMCFSRLGLCMSRL